MHVGVSHAHAISVCSRQRGHINLFGSKRICLRCALYFNYRALIASSSLIAFAMYLGHEEGEGRRARTLCDYDEGTVCTFALS